MINEPFAEGDSFLHRADPRIKILGACLVIVVIAVSRSLTVATSGLMLAVLLTMAARLPIKEVLYRLAAVQIFIIFLWLILPLTGGGTSGLFGLSQDGITLALLISIKSNAILLLTMSLLATSPLQRIGQGMNRLHFPPKLTMLLLFTYRYLFVIAEEFQKLRRAAKLRCFRPNTSLHTYRSYGYLIGMTIVRSWERAGRIHNAMIMRGFSGTFHQVDFLQLQSIDWLLSLFFVIITCILLALNFT